MADKLVTQVGRDGTAATYDDDEHVGCCAALCGGGVGGSGGGSGGLQTPTEMDHVDMSDALLPALHPDDAGKKCLVLDLDETLVHSSFKPVPNADFVVPVKIEDQVYEVYVLKRPRVDEFMRQVGELFEVVIFTASLSKYADPVCDLLDIHKVTRHRLFREHCSNHKGNYVKDLRRLGRPMKDIIIIDNSPASYAFQPENAVPIDSWFDDVNDNQLEELMGLLSELAACDDVVALLESAF